MPNFRPEVQKKVILKINLKKGIRFETIKRETSFQVEEIAIAKTSRRERTWHFLGSELNQLWAGKKVVLD